MNLRKACFSSSASPPASLPPVHRALPGHAAQALGRHRALQRMEVGILADVELERVRVVQHLAPRVAEIPSEAVEVAEDMARRARRLAVARRRRRVVEERPPVDDRGRLGIVQTSVVDLEACRGVDRRDRVVETGRDVEPPARLVEDEARRPAAAHRDLRGRVGDDGVALDLGGREHADLGRAEGRDPQPLAVGGDRHADRRRERALLRAGGTRHDRVVDVLVQAPRQDVRAVEDGDPCLVQVAVHRRTADEAAGALEADLVAGLGVRRVDAPALRVHREVEQDRADRRPRLDLHRHGGVRVDAEDVEVRQREAHRGAPVAADLVLPLRRHPVEADDQSGLGPEDERRVRIRGG